MKVLLACVVWVVPLAIAGSPTDIVINEIMYNPPDDGTGDELEYVELYNRGDEDVDIGGWQFTDGIEFTFPAWTVIEANGYLVVCSDPTATVEKYLIFNVIGPFGGRLDNKGDRIAISDDSPDPMLIDEVEYKTGEEWPSEADGDGPSLELVNPSVDNNIGGYWRASYPPEDNGTPGR